MNNALRNGRFDSASDLQQRFASADAQSVR